MREIIRLLQEYGWTEMRSKGSHRHCEHPDQRYMIVAPGNEGKEFATGRLKAILRKAWIEMSVRRYALVIEQPGTGYSAYSPDVPGCAAVGDTVVDLHRNFQDVLTAHIEAMREVGEPIPEPHSSVDYVEVAA